MRGSTWTFLSAATNLNRETSASLNQDAGKTKSDALRERLLDQRHKLRVCTNTRKRDQLLAIHNLPLPNPTTAPPTTPSTSAPAGARAVLRLGHDPKRLREPRVALRDRALVRAPELQLRARLAPRGVHGAAPARDRLPDAPAGARHGHDRAARLGLLAR